MTAGAPATPDPPVPFEAQTILMSAGTVTYRLRGNDYGAAQFNKGPKGPGRFHFFDDPQIPVLYTAATERAAVAETLLRNIPATGGHLPYSEYRRKVMSAVRIKKDVRLASFLGTDLRALGVTPDQLTMTPGDNYPQTRKWAKAAHDAGFDGIAWMSRHDNCDRSYMFFGGRVTEDDFEEVPGSGRLFATGPGQDWLIDLCAPLHIDVLPEW